MSVFLKKGRHLAPCLMKLIFISLVRHKLCAFNEANEWTTIILSNILGGAKLKFHESSSSCKLFIPREWCDVSIHINLNLHMYKLVNLKPCSFEGQFSMKNRKPKFSDASIWYLSLCRNEFILLTSSFLFIIWVIKKVCRQNLSFWKSKLTQQDNDVQFWVLSHV